MLHRCINYTTGERRTFPTAAEDASVGTTPSMSIWFLQRFPFRRIAACLVLAVLLIGSFIGAHAADAHAVGIGPAATGNTSMSLSHSPNSVIPSTPWVHEVAQNTTLYGYNTGPVTASCAAGEVALGGGWKIATQGVHVFAAYLTGNTWNVYASHTVHSRFLVPIVVTAYVECLSNDPGAIVTQFSTITDIPANSTADPTTLNPCYPNAGLPVAVGFDLGPANSPLEYQTGFINDIVFAGLVAAYAIVNHDVVDHPVTTYLECLASPDAAFNYVVAGGPPISAGMIADVQVTCPVGSVVASGGFGYTGGTLDGNLYLEHTNNNGWEGAVYALSGSSNPQNPPGVIAVCLSFGSSPGLTQP